MVIDALEFARLGRDLEGVHGVCKFARFSQDLPGPQLGLISWELVGRHRLATQQSWLDIRASGLVRLRCQRCLQLFDYALALERSLGLAATQAELDALDQLTPDDGSDESEYILADKKLDVLDLLEDELILALPYVPRHQHCPQELDAGARLQADESPFAALKQLKLAKKPVN